MKIDELLNWSKSALGGKNLHLKKLFINENLRQFIYELELNLNFNGLTVANLFLEMILICGKSQLR